MLTVSAFALAFAALNRARGQRLFDQVSSTTITRLVSTLGMALLAALASQLSGWEADKLLLWAWGTLYLWSVPGWGKYVGAAIGGGLKAEEREFTPVDWIMERLSISEPRLWGTVAMSLRMTLAAPCVIGVAYQTGGDLWWATATLLLGIPYLICGHLFGAKGWQYGEYCAGGMLGVIIIASIG